MNKVVDIYEQYWGGKEKREVFGNYERNLAMVPLLRKNETVLDVGCGDGAVGEFLIQNYQNTVYGLDFSSKALAVASKRGLKVKLGSSEEKFPFPDKMFDTVFWGDNIEHLFYPDNTIAEIKRILKNGGRVIVSCPNMGYWRFRLEYLIRGEISRTEWMTKYSWQTQHIRFFNKSLISQFLNLHGFKVTKFLGASKRRLDLPLLAALPQYFGMIMIVEAIKND